MKTNPVSVVCSVHAKIAEHPFRYRVYVDNELFTERTWSWPSGIYLEEMLLISAPPGVYPIKFELVDVKHGKIRTENYRTTGPARMIVDQDQVAVEILDESA